MNAITDRTPVRTLLNAEETWRGTLADFERINQFEDSTCAEIRTALHQIGRVCIGNAALVVEIVPASWLVTTIGAKGATVFRCSTEQEANLTAGVAMLSGRLVSLLNPAGEYVPFPVMAFQIPAAQGAV